MSRDHQWTVVWLLVVVVLVPSATVLWLTTVATRNERAASKARLMAAYQSQLETASIQIDNHWNDVDQRCHRIVANTSGQRAFEACVNAGLADSVLIVADGALVYPAPDTQTSLDSLNEAAWAAANRLEFVAQNFAIAADAYAAIANVEPDPNAEARAWIGHARCLQKDDKTGNLAQVIDVLVNTMNRSELRSATHSGGRSYWLDAQLRALELMQNSSFAADKFAARKLTVRGAIRDYNRPFPASQRLFAMRRFTSLFPTSESFATYDALQLAEKYAARIHEQALDSRTDWNLASDPHCVSLKSCPVVLIYRKTELAEQIRTVLQPWQTVDAGLQLVSENQADRSSDDSSGNPAENLPVYVATVPIESMPGRRLGMTLTNPDLFEESSRHQAAIYAIAGLITIAIVCILAFAIALFVRRQLRLAQLKSDLATVVSHELRTPLASVRVLVDTLLDDTLQDPQQRTEYLQLIAQENERLSRLIENFLRFSRIERNSERYQLTPEPPAQLVTQAVSVVGNKLNQAGTRFSTTVDPDVPSVAVDRDAFVTVLANLLDNAVKFTDETALIELRVCTDKTFVVFEVIDDGIGMSASDAKHIFEKFYQSDTLLSRSHGGCGLGLSLVRSIVEGHGGSVEVQTTPGEGSTFRVKIPASQSTDQVDEKNPTWQHSA